MKYSNGFLKLALALLMTGRVLAQDAGIDLKTGWAGQPPGHETPNSAAKWIQEPVGLTLEVAVTNLCAATNACLEVDIGGQQVMFYGAGQDNVGNYIPTNYAPVAVSATLRRQYQANVLCPNSGPDGSPLFCINPSINRNDFAYPYDFVSYMTNAPTDLVSAFLWASFTSNGQKAITNASSLMVQVQTNLIQELNRVITAGSIYNPTRFAGVLLGSDTTNLLAQNPVGQNLAYLNRLLLRDAYGYFHYYQLPVPAPDNSGTAQVNFYVKPPQQLKMSFNQNSPQYSVLVNGPNTTSLGNGSAQVSLINSGNGYVSTNNPMIQLTKAKYSHFSVGDGCDDLRPAPSVGKWLSMGPGCTADTNRIALEWSVSLGRTFDGLAAGILALREPQLSTEIYTPYSLYYNAASTNILAEAVVVTTNVAVGTYTNYAAGSWTNLSGQVFWGTVTNVTTNTDLVLRQVRTYQTFVDILAPNTNQTVIKFYFPAQVGTNQDQNGLFTNINGQPFDAWIIQNPNPGTASSLLIMETRLGGGGFTNLLTKTSTAGGVSYSLTQGSGPEARVETRTVSFIGNPATSRVEVDVVQSSGTTVYQCQETYNFYPWGSELVETRVPNNPDYVTSFNYYNDPNLSDPTEDPYGYGYGQLREILYPDGYWEKREYGIYDDNHYQLNCRTFHPFLMSSTGGTTSADQATEYNSSIQDIMYFDLGSEKDQIMIQYDQMQGFNNGWATLGTETSTYDLGNYMRSLSSSGPGEGRESDLDNIDLSDVFDYSTISPPGLTGHSLLSHGNLNDKFFYYDHGTFNPSANAFVLDTNNHFYTWEGMATNYPDHRETQIDAPADQAHDDNQYFGWYACGQISGYAPPEDYYSSVAGHPLGDGYYYSGTPFYPGNTRMHTRIYHAGSLTLTEEYLYTGGDGNGNPIWALLYKYRYYNDSLGRATNVVRIEPSGQTRTLYNADYQGGTGYDGELLISETDENGQRKSYVYDSLQRVKTTTVQGYGSHQPNKVMTYAYDANGQVTSRNTTAGTLAQNESWAFDRAGRLTNHVDPSGIAVQISYSPDNLTVTTNFPGGISTVAVKSIDRYPASLQGNGCVTTFYSHDSAFTPIYVLPTRVQTTYLGHANSPRWQLQATDDPGNADAWQVRPVNAGTTNTISLTRWYNANRLQNESYSYGVGVHHYYDYNGNECFKNTYLTTLQLWNPPGRETASITSVINLNGAWYQATTNFVYLDDLSEALTVTGIHLEQLNGFNFANNQITCALDYDADTNQTITTTYLDRANNKTTTVTSQPNTSLYLSATNVYQNGLLISSSTLSVASPTQYFYDALGRTNVIQSPLNCFATINYDPVTGRVTSQTDFTGQTTSYQYYNTNQANAGKLKCQTSATGKNIYYAYTTLGQFYQTWGDVPNPAEYFYNEYGDLTNLITFRGGSNWTSSSWPTGNTGTGDNTYWYYDAASGALTNKTDALGYAVTYTYDTNTAKLLTRTWARANGSITVTNGYDAYGDLVSQQYSDGTPNVYLKNYNRAAKPREIIDGSGTNELAYDFASRLVTAYGNGGLMSGITVSNHFNAFLGRDAVAVFTNSTKVLEDDYNYDGYGRMNQVSSGLNSATYVFVPNSDLLQTTTCFGNSGPVLTTTRTWDYGMRLRSIANVVNNNPVTSHNYQYDALNRRTQATLEDGSFWQYGYDDRDELTSARRNWSYFSTIKPASGQQFSYAYDNIGNRLTAQFGGDINGANLRTIIYTANSLNQYTSILTPGYENIIGAALATNSVTVNGGLADRHAEYFHSEISVANTNHPVWQSVTNIAGTFTNKGGILFPPNTQALNYDADGNLSSDGVWTYQWDAENRLISMAMNTNIAGMAYSNTFQLQFVYDYMGRRVQKIVSSWNGSTFVPQSTNLFVYDGWNLLAVVNPQSSILRSFMWGNDLSGTINKAGGVGGLLMANISGTNCFATYDGNGNITALINAADKSLAARYEYSPYGELLRETGSLAHQNPFRFSTKFWDDETGIVYYNYRYYNPTLGKWISKDPLDEQNEINLYNFCHNDAIYRFDTDGRLDGVSDINGMYSILSRVLDKDMSEMTDVYGKLRGIQLKELLERESVAATKAMNNVEFLEGVGGVAALGVGLMVLESKIIDTTLEMEADMIGSEIQEGMFMKNAQRIITSRLDKQNAVNTVIGIGVGAKAGLISQIGGNGDDYVLDASLSAAGTMGVDSSETIWGIATGVEDAGD